MFEWVEALLFFYLFFYDVEILSEEEEFDSILIFSESADYSALRERRKVFPLEEVMLRLSLEQGIGILRFFG